MIRTAISPRLAMRIFENMRGRHPARCGGGRLRIRASARGAKAQLRHGHGPADVKALGVVDALRAHEGLQLRVADELRDRLLAQPAGDPHDGLDDELVGLVAQAARDELAVDLQVVEGQVLEVVERAEARAEVVEREAAAELRQPLGEAARERDVGHGGGLGDLEDQAARVDPRRVTSDSMRCSRAASLSDAPDRLISSASVPCGSPASSSIARVDDPAVDLGRQPEALGERQERGGEDQLVVVAEHAQQQLVLADLARAQVADRLGVQDEAVVVERAAQPVQPAHAVADALRASALRRDDRAAGRGPPPWPRTSRGRPRSAAPRR